MLQMVRRRFKNFTLSLFIKGAEAQDVRLARAALDLLPSQQLTFIIKGRFSFENLPFLFVFHCRESLFDCVAQSLRKILNQYLF